MNPPYSAPGTVRGITCGDFSPLNTGGAPPSSLMGTSLTSLTLVLAGSGGDGEERATLAPVTALASFDLKLAAAPVMAPASERSCRAPVPGPELEPARLTESLVWDMEAATLSRSTPGAESGAPPTITAVLAPWTTLPGAPPPTTVLMDLSGFSPSPENTKVQKIVVSNTSKKLNQ